MSKLWLALLAVVVLGYWGFTRPHASAAGELVWVEEIQIGRDVYQ